MAEKPFLDKIYDVKTPEGTRAIYDEWAGSYDAEVQSNGYATPGRVAAALAAQVSDISAPVLDFGCGTGLSGAALHKAGFTTLDGADLSQEMLSHARNQGIYRKLWQVEADADLPVAPGDYAAIVATGVIGRGAAPIEVFDTLMAALGTGGRLAFSLNDHTLEDPAFEARVTGFADDGVARLAFREHGPHLPGIDLSSVVYVLEKM